MIISTDLDTSSTFNNIENLLSVLDKHDEIHNQIFPKTLELAKKLINTQQQLQYQQLTRENGCLPMGIARQCKFTFSGPNPDLQSQLQQLFHEAGSRSLDLIIQNTKKSTESLKRNYYNSRDILKSSCEETGVDFNTLHQKLQSSMRAVKQNTSTMHTRKIYRDLEHHKAYIVPPKSATPIISNIKPKSCRRFKKRDPKPKRPRRPKHRSKRQNLKSSGLPKPINIDKYYYNLTNIELTEHHKVILSLGQKFCPTPRGADWSNFETCIDNWSYLLRYAVYFHGKPNLNSDFSYERLLVKRQYRRPIASSSKPALELFIQRVKADLLTEQPSKFVAPNLTQELRNALREMKFWDKDHDVIIRPYDKGQGYFIDYKNAYKARIITELNSGLYTQIDNKSLILTEVTMAIEAWCSKWENEKLLTPTLCQWLTPDNSRKPGNIYMNYKRHKPESNFPGRLITSGVGSLTENISSLVALELKPLAKHLPHVLTDTNHLLRRLKEINDSNIIKNKDIIHVSWDVVAMFPNIPEEIGLAECKELLDERSKKEGLPTDCVLEALKICLHYNISQFDDEWYRQDGGAAMGPHEACHYCDIAMSHIDKKVFSDDNPHKKPFIWLRFRDDIWDSWLHGEEELLKFTEWLNSIHPKLKFTVKYTVGEGVEFLDTYIYDKDGIVHTDLFSKASDTHAYLPPGSCHPYHICKNNPDQTARRVRKICSEESSYSRARAKFSNLLIERGYSESSCTEAFEKYNNIPREDLFSVKNEPSTKRCFPLVCEYNPHLPAVAPVLKKHMHILELDPVVSAAIPQGSVFASYRQPKSIKDMLVHSRFISTDNNNDDDQASEPGSFACGDCFFCNSYLEESKTFKSYHSSTEFQIKQHITCHTEGIIYLINDTTCKRSYIGSAITTMKERMSNYKNHINTEYKGCEVAQHFACSKDIHSLYTNDTISRRSKEFQDAFDKHLCKQLRYTLIESVDLSLAKTTKEKRALIEVREGHWQTQLRTLSRYGGLNKKDDRLITNRRFANHGKVAVSSTFRKPDNEVHSCSDTVNDVTINTTVAVLDAHVTFVAQSSASSVPTPEPAPDPAQEPAIRRSSRLRKPTKCYQCD